MLRVLKSFCRTDTIVVFGQPRVGLVGAFGIHNCNSQQSQPPTQQMKVGQNLSQKKPLTIILPSTSTLPPTIDPDRDKKIIIGVVVGAVVVVVLMIMALFLCRKATKTDKKYLKLLKKYQDLQKTISKECKQCGF